MDKIFSMRVFSRIAETGSFSAVARQMACSAGNVSRAVVSLEEGLHTRLLQRTTRRVALTESGERYYERCKKILADLDDADAEASDAGTVPRGTLRVHAVPDVGLAPLASTVVEYRQRFPDVSVDLVVAPQMASLINDAFDVSILSAQALPDSNNVSRLIGRCERVLVASPAYLARHPVVSADDLATHALMQTADSPDPASDWLPALAHDPDGGNGARASAARFVVNDAQAVRAALLAGAGVGALPAHAVHDDLEHGRLLRVLPECAIPSVNLFVVYPGRRLLDAKVRTFVDCVVTSLRDKLDLRGDVRDAEPRDGAARNVRQTGQTDARRIAPRNYLAAGR
ncbi:LysR family transcriptional regulator [Paraburkholderia sp.]|uniref:LysR family transcriptional regulator n=1 Tax=Paraburkholderia sp. TaxID=1926495 RepID=UPI0023874E29|nr:LysR family transcriptional regulator [Paraburkholderia sp.]MDE1182129.1 LysR family transcriptional regulator [Paraburkholderia sp.]